MPNYGNTSQSANGHLTLHRFYFDAISRARNKKERYGQAMMNHLRQVRRDLYLQIRDTDKDPYNIRYLTDPEWDRFVEFVEVNWRVKKEM